MMDKVTAFFEENKDLIVSVVHLAVVIPLIFLAIRPEFLPVMVRRDFVMYAVYALLAVGVVSHGKKLVEAVKVRVEKKANEVVLVSEEKSEIKPVP